MPTSNLLFRNIKFVQNANSTSTLKSEEEQKRESFVRNAINTSSGTGAGAGTTPPLSSPEASCGNASANTVDNIYPKSVSWYGKAPVLVPVQNPPTYKVILAQQKEVSFEKTIVTPEQYIQAANEIISKLSPSISTDNRKKIITSAYAISRQEQGGPNGGFKGFNNNISGIESSGFSVFEALDVVGKVPATEGGTGKRKYYYAFSSISSGLIPLISNIMKRNMYPTGGTAGEFAWRYYRDWNGYGARAVNSNDCTNVESFTQSYINAKKRVDQLI